jgi:hypothetical protein
MGVEVLPAAGRWEDFASFMVPRKPGPRGCVCMAYRNSSLDMPGRIAHMRALCNGEPGPGVLAHADGQTAGWCSAAPKSTYRALVNSRAIPHVQDEDAWSVVCFVVRRQGAARTATRRSREPLHPEPGHVVARAARGRRCSTRNLWTTTDSVRARPFDLLLLGELCRPWRA